MGSHGAGSPETHTPPPARRVAVLPAVELNGQGTDATTHLFTRALMDYGHLNSHAHAYLSHRRPWMGMEKHCDCEQLIS